LRQAADQRKFQTLVDVLGLFIIAKYVGSQRQG